MPACASWRRDGSGKAEQGSPGGASGLGGSGGPHPVPSRCSLLDILVGLAFAPWSTWPLARSAHHLPALVAPAPLLASLPALSRSFGPTHAMLQPQNSPGLFLVSTRKPHMVPPASRQGQEAPHCGPQASLVGLCQPLPSHLPPVNPRHTHSECSTAATQLLHSPRHTLHFCAVPRAWKKQ